MRRFLLMRSVLGGSLAASLVSASPAMAAPPPAEAPPASVTPPPAPELAPAQPAEPTEPAAQPSGPSTPVPPPGVAASERCAADSDCPGSATCRGGQCRVPPLDIDRQQALGQGNTVAGVIVIAVGGIMALTGASLVVVSSSTSPYDADVPPGTWEAGWALSAIGIGGLITGTVLLAVGQSQLAGARPYQKASISLAPSTRGGRLDFALRF